MKSIRMMNKNLQDDDQQSFHESIPPADVGDIITNWIEFDEIFLYARLLLELSLLSLMLLRTRVFSKVFFLLSSLVRVLLLLQLLFALYPLI